MSKQNVHFEFCGYEPMRMKPVHFATGFFLSLLGKYYRLELLNKVSIVRTSRGLIGDYDHGNLMTNLQGLDLLSEDIGLAELKLLRTQINGLMDNDEGVFPAFGGYSTFGNDYSLISDHFITSQRQMDGFAGFFLHQVFTHSEEGRCVVEFCLKCISEHDSPIESFLKPLLDDDDEVIEWDNKYESLLGQLSNDRLECVASRMSKQTAAIAQLCKNMEKGFPQHSKLRNLIIALCSWLFLYIQRVDIDRTPLLFMDFSGGSNPRIRAASRASFTRQREHFCSSYQRQWDPEGYSHLEKDYEALKKTKFKFLEQHFSDLAIRVGFAQPRAAQARLKHFELQPDTIRVLTMTVLEAGELLELEEMATRLRETWGVCCGGCHDDPAFLCKNEYMGIDLDEDLEPNVRGYVSLLKKMNLATEPSDGLVLCALEPGD